MSVRRRRAALGIWARIALAVLLVALAAAALAASAQADGDPGSDVLLDQNLFTSWDSGISFSQQLQLGRLLHAAASARTPVRVAIVAHPDDLGAVTSLWQKPETYALYLGTELSLVYPGRLLVVMPDGFGFYWHGHPSGPGYAALAGIAVPAADTAAELITSTDAGVYKLEQVAGTSKAALDAANNRGANATATATAAELEAPAAATGIRRPAAVRRRSARGGHGWVVAIVLIVLLMTVVWVPALWRGHDRVRVWMRRVVTAGPRVGVALPAVGGLVVTIVAIAIAIPHLETGSTSASTLQNNPNLDPGTTLPPREAPQFTLVDETGHPVSLSQYRGKVVILSFIDAECQTLCPLTTTAMLDAKRALGPAGKDVQLLGINANWRSTQIDDVLNYTQLHGMTGQWHFLTGSLAQLNRVWTAYGVNEFKLEEKAKSVSRLIDHVAATVVIDPQGRWRTLYTTAGSYAAVPQLGQLLAQDASRLLPAHPRVETDYSYAEVMGTPPTSAVSLPRQSGGKITLGPGRTHLYLFFATWDQQTAPLAADLQELNSYDQTSRHDSLPRVTAVDEGSVEPSPMALPEFLRSLPARLHYPVAIDTTGKLADGYNVEGEPWLVLTNAAGHKIWYQEVYTAGWPSLTTLVSDVRGALSPGAGGTTTSAVAHELAGSPAPLAALHQQASQVLPGGQRALDARIAALQGYPIVVNAWGSWCGPCQSESHLFARASAEFGTLVAFLGADTNEPSPADGQQFLDQHHVSYPSYETTPASMQALLPGGLEGTPTTIFIAPDGRQTLMNLGPYESQGALDQAIKVYALGGTGTMPFSVK
ncbi:MAG TPA: SCO family protein [Solirubrobacteraceae bacterium]